MIDYAQIVKTRMAEIGANNGKPGSTAACLQVESEMVWLAPFIDRLKPKVILEIGIYKAGWPYVLAPFFAKGAHIIGIDAMLRHSWNGDEGRKDLDVRVSVLRQQGFTVDIIEGRSTDKGVPTRAWQALKAVDEDGEVDLLHIDGAHDYESVRRDWNTYCGIVRPGGLIILHDIGTHTSQMNVKALWEDVKGHGFTTHEFYEKNGIGVVEV